MPRPSLDPDKAKQSQFENKTKVEAGVFEVLSAKTEITKGTFATDVAQLSMILEVALLDKSGARVGDAEPISLQFGISKALDKFAPGVGKDINDESPVSAGTEVGATGNTVYFDGAGELSGSSGTIVFMKSLKKLGFPNDVLDFCWFPAFKGLKFSMITKTAKEINDLLGVRLNTKDGINGKPVPYRIATEWLNRGYLTGKKEEPKAAPASVTANIDVEDLIAQTMAKVAEVKAGSPIKSMQALKGFFTHEFTKAKFPTAKLAQAQRIFANPDGLNELIGSLGGYEADDKSIMFPALELVEA